MVTKRRKQNLHNSKTTTNVNESITWWLTPPAKYKDMENPKYHYHPNELCKCISKNDKEQHYQEKDEHKPGAPLLKDHQRRLRNFCRRKAGINTPS